MSVRQKGSKAARRERRLADKTRRQEAERRRRGQRRLLLYGGIAAAVVGLAALVWFVARPGQAPARAQPGPAIKTYPEQGRDHIAFGTPHPAYSSNPPSSGWHTPVAAPWGASARPIPDEVLVHNLEHGGIWISYRDATDTATVRTLQEIVSRYRSKVILTPRAQNPAPIAVVAWRNVMLLDGVNERAIVDFIDRFKNKGPELVPD